METSSKRAPDALEEQFRENVADRSTARSEMEALFRAKQASPTSWEKSGLWSSRQAPRTKRRRS